MTLLQSCQRTEYASSTLSYFAHIHIRLAPVGLDHIFNPLQVCVRSHREAHGVKPLLMPDWIYQKHQHLLFQPSQLAFLLLFIPLFSSCHPRLLQRNGFGICSGPTSGAKPSNMDFHPTTVSLSSRLCGLLLLSLWFPIGSTV